MAGPHSSAQMLSRGEVVVGNVFTLASMGLVRAAVQQVQAGAKEPVSLGTLPAGATIIDGRVHDQAGSAKDGKGTQPVVGFKSGKTHDELSAGGFACVLTEAQELTVTVPKSGGPWLVAVEFVEPIT